MTDDTPPPTALPDHVEARDIWLAWIPDGLVPLTSYKEENWCGSLKEAVDKAMVGYADKRKEKLAPWIRAGTGHGAFVLNIQGILLLRAAYDEGRHHAS